MVEHGRSPPPMDLAKPDLRNGFSVLDDITSVTLATALNGLAMRQNVTSNNIANLETPGFTASSVNFEDSLRSAVDSGDPASANIATTATTDAPGVNGNNVNLDRETLISSQAQLQYSLLTNAVTSKYNLINTVLKG